MPAEIVYMNTSGNIAAIFEKIRSAGAPPKFTHEFLKSNLGFASSNDRGVIKIMKQLGFLDESSIPQPRYHEYRDTSKSEMVMAAGLREGWSEVFLSDQAAYDKSATQLKAIFQSITGKGEAVAEKMASTFKALCALADFSAAHVESPAHPADAPSDEVPVPPVPTPTPGGAGAVALHQDVHVHLPATTDVAVFTAIFLALREELLG